ncbi:MAG: hypothetical protein IPI01_21470 [Ignavibacteriae bacterium]|nr:hypothetical protein [Ignavibacteriota bacterium]
MRSLSLSFILLFAPCVGAASITDSSDVPGLGHWGLMAGNSGISFGNGQDMNGIRFAWRDGAFVRVDGINLSLWKPYNEPRGEVNGFSFGVLAAAGQEMNGITAGIGGVVATGDLTGLNMGGLGMVSGGDATGINLGGLGTVAMGNMTGMNFGGSA